MAPNSRDPKFLGRKKGAEEGRHGESSSRRDFLKTTTLAGTTLAYPSASPSKTTSRKVRIGIAGGGNFGCSFQWHEHPDCIVQAVTDLLPDRRKRLMQTYRCTRSYDSLEEMVQASDIDAVGVFTDGPLHTQHVEQAMRHGKHVISAVPAAWGTLEDCLFLRDTVEKYGLTYMLCETGYYQPEVIAARELYRQGAFGDLFYCESEYQHPGLKVLYVREGKKTWRYGMAPMHYPTHNTAKFISVTGERLTHVSCYGWGDGSESLRDNPYGNPFWNESALFRTDRGHSFRLTIWWEGAFLGAQRAQWIGSRMSLFMQQANGQEPVVVRAGPEVTEDSVGYAVGKASKETFVVPEYWKSDLLPEPLRHPSGHWNSHCFLTHEFIDALVHDRKPAIDVDEALAYTVPGITAHESALRDGERLQVPDLGAGRGA